MSGIEYKIKKIGNILKTVHGVGDDSAYIIIAIATIAGRERLYSENGFYSSEERAQQEIDSFGPTLPSRFTDWWSGPLK